MLSQTRGNFTIFEYLYRDAGNFKSYGSILLLGQISRTEHGVIERKMESGEFFIAEQIGVKALYKELYKFSGGMTQQDHVWHSFVEFRGVNDDDHIDDMEVWGTVVDFIKKFASIGEWNLRLSRHAMLMME
jgi:hypothetical protein